MMFVFGALGFIIVVVLLFWLREPQRTERRDSGLGSTGGSLGKTLVTVLSVPSFLLLALVFVLASNVVQQLDYFLPRHFSDHYNMKLAAAGRMATLAPQIGTVIGVLIGGVLADRLARKWRSGRFQVQILGLAMAIPAVFTIAVVDSTNVILVAMFIHGVGFWLYLSNLWTTTFEVVDPAARSTAIGLLNVTAGILGSWPLPLVGKLRDTGVITDLRSVFLVFGYVLCVAVVLLVLLVCKTLPRDYLASSNTRTEP
jgi:MFS family permease